VFQLKDPNGAIVLNTLTLTAGAGAAVVATLYALTTTLQRFAIRAAWAVTDTGWTEVTLAVSGLHVQHIGIYDYPRTELETTDHGVQIADSTHARITLREGFPIARAAGGSPRACLVAIKQAWDDCRRTAVGWSSLVGIAVTSGSLTNPFGPDGTAWRHRARLRVAGEATKSYAMWVYSKVTAGSEFSIEGKSNNSIASDSTVTLTALDNTTVAANKCSPILVDASGYGDLTVRAAVTSGGGTCTIYGVTIGEE
jgi:hypothetical protein